MFTSTSRIDQKYKKKERLGKKKGWEESPARLGRHKNRF